MRGAVPLMRRYGWGRIVNIASIDGLTPKPTRGAYCSSKSALIALTRSVALDVAKDGITANSVCPGSMKTYRAMKTVARRIAAGVVASEEDAFAAEVSRIPIGRFGEVEEVARIVSFLASDAAGYVTAEAWGAHGGQLFTGYLGT
jgi:3-hydroxybutyrate dehydrogenase